MGLLDLASSASAWRGYEYYKDGSVLLKKKVTDHEYSGSLRGSGTPSISAVCLTIRLNISSASLSMPIR